MVALTPRENTSRIIFDYLQNLTRKERMFKPGAASDETLLRMIEDDVALLDRALRAGKNATDDFDPAIVAVIAAKIATDAYAIARNNGVLNTIDIPEAIPLLQEYNRR